MADVACFKTTIGWIGLATTDKGVAQVLLGGRNRVQIERALATHLNGNPSPEASDGGALLRDAQAQIVDYLNGRRTDFSLPVDLSAGTSFQRRVWRSIERVPYSRVRSYQWVATRVGGRQYARAVGMALGANPVPLIIPCHRIVAQDGSLGGFSCGLPLKRRLLDLEGSLALLLSR